MHRLASLSAARAIIGARSHGRVGTAAANPLQCATSHATSTPARSLASSAKVRPGARIHLNTHQMDKLAKACRRVSTVATNHAKTTQAVDMVASIGAIPAPAPQTVRRSGLFMSSNGLPYRAPLISMPTRFVQMRSTADPSVRVRERERETVQRGPVQSGSTPVAPTSTSAAQQHQQQAVVGDDSAAARVIANPGLSNFLGRTYKTTGLSVAATLLGSYGLAILLPPAAFMPALIGGFVVSLGSIFGMYATRPETTKVLRPNGQVELTTVNSPARKAIYVAFTVANSLTLTPLVAMMTALHPLIIPISAVGAGMVMAGSSMVAFRKPAGSLLALQGPLFGGLLSLIVLNIGGLASVAIWGPTIFSNLVFSGVPYLTVGLFSVMNAFDTHQAIREYEKGQADHLIHSVGFYLNFLNLLSAIAQIIANMLRD